MQPWERRNNLACSNADNCNSNNFTFPDYNYILRDYQVASFGLSSAVTITTSNLGTSSASATATNSDLVSASATATNSGTRSIQSEPPEPSAPCAAEGPLQAEVNAEQQKLVAVGAGVGGPLGFLCLSFLALFLLERRKRRRVVLKDSNDRSKSLEIVPVAHGLDLQHKWQAQLDENLTKHEMGGDNARSELANNTISHQTG